MKKFFNIFFITLGVIFLIIIVGALFFYIASQFGVSTPRINSNGVDFTPAASEGGDQNPYLSPAQESALKAMGIDPASVPTSISPEQESCFAEKLGQERVNEIKGGDAPTPVDYYKAKSCI